MRTMGWWDLCLLSVFYVIWGSYVSTLMFPVAPVQVLYVLYETVGRVVPGINEASGMYKNSRSIGICAITLPHQRNHYSSPYILVIQFQILLLRVSTQPYFFQPVIELLIKLPRSFIDLWNHQSCLRRMVKLFLSTGYHWQHSIAQTIPISIYGKPQFP